MSTDYASSQTIRFQSHFISKFFHANTGKICWKRLWLLPVPSPSSSWYKRRRTGRKQLSSSL